MDRFVEITFDCLPLRSVGRLDIPLDASPKYRARCERIKHAIETHGFHNSYFLFNAKCIFHLTNNRDFGMLEFEFDGTVLTDDADLTTRLCDLRVELVRETCEWLIQPVEAWFKETVPHAVTVEFNRYIEAGDLEQTKQRAAMLQAKYEQSGGYVGMYL